MKISIDRLQETPTAFAFQGDSRWWGARIPEHQDRPFQIEVRAHRMGEDVYLEGRLEGDLELACSRCLALHRYALSEPFRLVLEPAGAREPADPEGAASLARYGLCLGDELEAGWFRGSEIDLAAFLFELASLAVPVKPLCSEDCRGLCSSCGADLNESPCDCSEIRPDSPFAVLGTLRDGHDRETS
jgi:uncharacterized protein